MSGECHIPAVAIHGVESMSSVQEDCGAFDILNDIDEGVDEGVEVEVAMGVVSQ